MKGLELSRRYFETVARDSLEARFGDAAAHMSIGLAGEGSECLGFDDQISQDHDFSPAFCLWLDRADYEALGPALREWYASLPKAFLGFDDSRDTPNRACRVGVFDSRSWFARYLGPELPPSRPMTWLGVREEVLAAASSGELFQDGSREFAQIRQVLLAGYPEDVRLKKLAARLAAMAQSGQYNYARCMRRGDAVAALLCVTEFLKAAMSAAYLLEGRYMPYYKWSFRGMEDFTGLRELRPLLRRLAETPEQEAAWSRPVFSGAVNREDCRAELMERCCALIADACRQRGLTQSGADFLDPVARDIQSRIRDPQLRALPLLHG